MIPVSQGQSQVWQLLDRMTLNELFVSEQCATHSSPDLRFTHNCGLNATWNYVTYCIDVSDRDICAQTQSKCCANTQQGRQAGGCVAPSSAHCISQGQQSTILLTQTPADCDWPMFCSSDTGRPAVSATKCTLACSRHWCSRCSACAQKEDTKVSKEGRVRP